MCGHSVQTFFASSASFVRSVRTIALISRPGWIRAQCVTTMHIRWAHRRFFRTQNCLFDDAEHCTVDYVDAGPGRPVCRLPCGHMCAKRGYLAREIQFCDKFNVRIAVRDRKHSLSFFKRCDDKPGGGSKPLYALAE